MKDNNKEKATVAELKSEKIKFKAKNTLFKKDKEEWFILIASIITK